MMMRMKKTIDEETPQDEKHSRPQVDHQKKDDKDKLLGARETRRINILRVVTLILLLSFAVLASAGVYLFTATSETRRFEDEFATNAQRIIDSFTNGVERKLAAINSLADLYTAHALASNEKFPFVTLPNFEVMGANARIQADALYVQWTPLVREDQRLEWEEYSRKNRFHVTGAYTKDLELRKSQDAQFGFFNKNYTGVLPDAGSQGVSVLEEGDGLGFHPRIWSNGWATPRGDEKKNVGPYLPLWQRSPIAGPHQRLLNVNLATAKIFHGVLEHILASKQAVMNRFEEIADVAKQMVAADLKASQFRHEDPDPHLNEPHTFVGFPVFDTFSGNNVDRNVVGVLNTNVIWRTLFEDILPPSQSGYVCLLENSYEQIQAYRVDGPQVTFLGDTDAHDQRYNALELSADVNEYLAARSSPSTRSYTTVPLNRDVGKYRLRVYPTLDMEDSFHTNKPWIYCIATFSVFLITAVVLFILDRNISKRQRIIMERFVKTAEDSAVFERHLNEFLAHEVRNPIAAAMSAHGFIAAAVSARSGLTAAPTEGEDDDVGSHISFVGSLEEDVEIIGSSLYFVDDFLRSMLDLHRSEACKLETNLAPTDLLKDVLEPVRSILHQRGGGVDVTIECPDNLVASTDCLRLKQVIMNLGRNSLKFTTAGFVRFRAAVVNRSVELYVEDSGPGIPVDKRDHLFEKFQASLDVLSQGTGIGLSLCDNLVGLLGGSIQLDAGYDSGVPGSPGARFVIQLNQPALTVESILESSRTAGTLRGSGEMETALSPRLSEEFSQGSTTTATLPENLSVLFVDDDNVQRKLFSRAIRRVAPTWQISEAASGEAALELVEAEERDFDLIFQDQYMTSTEKQLLGTETIRELRSRGVKSKIAGLSANNLAEEFLKAGADAFSLKPLPCGKEAMERELSRILNVAAEGDNCPV